MKLKQEFYRLPFRFDVARLAAEALSFPEEAWRAHPSNYAGNTALILVSADGGINDDLSGPMKPTMHLAGAPYMRQVMASFGTVVGRSRLMRLAPGATVQEHTDINYYWRSHFRIHVPVVTHPSVEFYCNQKCVHMAAGEAWTFDNWQIHQVENPSEVTRIHLVIDTVGTTALWRLMKRSAAGNVEDRFVAYDPDATADALVTERYDSPPVPPPSEIDALGRELIEDIRLNPENDPAAVDSLAEAIDDLRADWRCQWLVHGPAAPGWAEYRRLLRAFTTAVTTLPRLAVASNGTTAQAIAHAQFDAAFAVDKISEPSRPAPSRIAAAPTPPVVPQLAPTAIQPEATFDEPVIIVAAPRSGSTMLFEALAQNRAFWTVGDESHLIIEGVSGLRPADHGFASNQLTAADAEGGIAAVLRRAFSAELRDSSGTAWRDLAPAVRATPLRFLEKTPRNALRIPFLAAVFPNALFIFMHRNPRDSISSLIDSWRSGRFVTYPQLPGWSGQPWSHLLIPGWRKLEGRPLAEVAARQWQVANETILADLETLPHRRWTATSYEQVLADPVGEFTRLCRFADVPFGPRMQQLTRSPLKPSRYTVTSPSPEKWRRNEAELTPVLPATKALAERLRRLQTTEALAPDVRGDVGGGEGVSDGDHRYGESTPLASGALKTMKPDRELAERQRAYGLHFDALVLHCPSPVRSRNHPVSAEWEAVCEHFFADLRLAGAYNDLDELTFVTINTDGPPGLLEECFNHIGMRHLAVLGRGIRDWQWSYKIKLVHDWLSAGGCKTPNLMYLDGDDVLLIGDPGDLLRRFHETGSDLLFCNTHLNWPPSAECEAFEAEAYADCGRDHQHLNAGGWIGSTAYITSLVAEIATAIDRKEAWCHADHGFDDQLAWKQLHRREYPRMQVDARCRVFLRFDGVR